MRSDTSPGSSGLNVATPEQLADLIREDSGSKGVEEIDDFEEWYLERFEGNELSDLLPPRLVLVGLGVDARAERMARFLAEGGIDISVLTFFGFGHSGETLLARQVEVERDETASSVRRSGQSVAEKRQALQKRLVERGMTDLFDDIAGTLRRALRAAAWIRPDGSGVIAVSGRRAPFLLEYDRGTLDSGDFAAKFGGYRRYCSCAVTTVPRSA